MAVQAISGSGASSFPTGVQLPPAAALRRSHTRGRRPPPFLRDSRVSWHTVSLRQSSEHPNTFTSLRRPHASVFGCSARGQETRKRVLELRCPVTVPREICSLGRMNDDRTDLEVFQQCRDLVFGDWTSATIFVPLRVWIGEKAPAPSAPMVSPCDPWRTSFAVLRAAELLCWAHMEYERGESQTDAPARANHHLHAAQFATAISSWGSADC